MQKINIVCVGRVKERFYREAVAEYAKRLSRFVSLSIRELPEGRNIHIQHMRISVRFTLIR